MKKIAFTGDLGFSSKYFRGTYAKEDLLHSSIVNYLSDTDHTVVNVEGCVGNVQGTAKKRLIHTNPPECVDFLKKINGNIWAISNNHIADAGREGIESTLKIAAENNIPTVGAGLCAKEAARPVIIENDGADIGIVAITYDDAPRATEDKEGCIMFDDDETVSSMIKGVKEKCRWCIVIVHAGPEFSQFMPAPVRKQYRKYLKFGADIVVGHHPHVAQNYEKVGDKIIFYSLGNFVFDTDYQRLQKYTEYGLFVKFCFYSDHFTWDHLAMKIDREEQRILPCETPDIFTHVSGMQYFLLTPLAMRILYRNEQIKLPYLNPKMKDYTKWQYFKHYMKKRKDGIRHRGIISANIAYAFGFWRLGNKKLKNFIKNGN